MLWNRFCVVVVSVVAHGRAIPLLWQTLEHPSASVSAWVSIALLEKADQLLAGFGAITLLADRAFPCEELLSWFRGRSRWSYVMRLRVTLRSTAPQCLSAVRCASCTCAAGSVQASVVCVSGPMAARV